MKKVGITAAQCALGIRAAMIMNKIGVKEDDIEYFISDIYNRCKDIGISVENVAIHLQNLLEFSRTTSPIPISGIDDYQGKKMEQKTGLERQMECLRQQVEDLDSKRSAIKNLPVEPLQQQKMTTSDLQWYSDLKAELGRYGIPVEDISRLAKTVRGIREQDYDANRVVTEFSNLEQLAIKKNNLQQYARTLEARLATLNRQCSESEIKINFHNEAISNYTKLESIGFGLKELTLLWGIVNEILVYLLVGKNKQIHPHLPALPHLHTPMTMTRCIYLST